MNDNIIKMFIGGEEVVSNKEFTINEEMLSASSTILNNCYPASWEESKDYVSNFYYPKDYSRCIIGKGNFKYGTDRYAKLNVSGIFPTFETNTEKPFDKIQIDGKSTQETRSGKNLFNKNSTAKSNGAVKEVLDTGVRAKLINSGNYRYFSIELGKSEFLGKTITLTRTITNSASNVGQIALYFGNETAQSKKIIFANKESGTSNICIPNVFPEDCDRVWILFYGNVAGTGNVGDYVDYTNLMITVGDTLENYEDYGVSPSPDYPSEVECVKGKNLYGNITWKIQTYAYFQLPTLNEDYTLSLKLKEGKTIPAGLYVMFTEKGFYDTTQKRIFLIDNGIQQFIYKNNTLNNVKLNYISVYPSEYKDTLQDYFDIQLEKGTQATTYEPYNTIQVKNVGKNLFNGIFELGIINGSTGQNETNNNYIRNKNYIPVEELTDYKFSSIDFTGSVNIYEYREDFSYNLTTNKQIALSSYLTTNKDTKYVRFRPASATTNLDLRFQLEKGTQATDYEPYQENTLNIDLQGNELCSLPNKVKDELVIENGKAKIIKRIDKIVLNGTENWQKRSSTSQHTFLLNMGQIIDRHTYAYCTHFTEISASELDNTTGIYSKQTLSLLISYLECSTVEEFKTWLSTHNTTVYYELATPTEIELGEVDALSTFKGVNNVSLDASMQTNMNLTYLWENYGLLFCGIVKNSGDISLRPTDPKYCSLQILDYKTFLSESDTLDFVISDKTIAEAISMVVDAISGYGFILGTINMNQAKDVIGAYSTLNKTAYDVFQYLANISGSRWRTRFVDSDTMAIDFYDPELLPRANDIDYTQQYWEDNKIVDLTFNYGTRDYRNKQIILSNEVYGGIDYTEVLLSNGYGTSYITQNNIANITSITVNGVKAKVITQSEKDLGVDADFYYTPGKNVVDSTTSYTAGTQIIITYTPLVKGRQIVYNDEEVTRIATQTNTTGIISRYENRNDILSSDELENIAKTYIKYKGKPEIILKLTTLNNDLFNIGEICYFNSPIADLAQDYMIKSKAINFISVAGETNIFYTYELTSSFNSEKAINYFDNQRNKTTGNIAVGESITRNIDINNSAMIIWENATITEISVSVDGDNALNSVLNSPFIQ